MQFQPRILVCLASDQIMQNTLPALRLRSAHVVIATSDVDPVRKGAEQVSHVLRDAGWPEDAVRIVEHTPDHDLASVTRYARELASDLQRRHPGLPIDLNASGGTKVMSFGFLGALSGLGDAWYCDTRHSMLEHLGGAASLELPADMLHLNDVLQMQGYRVVADPTWNVEFASAAAARADLTDLLAREAPQLNGYFGYVNRLTREAIALTRPDGSIARPFRSEVIAERQLFRNNHELARAFEQAAVWQWDGDRGFLFADEAAARYAGGGWLEEWAWLTLARLQADGVLPDGHWGTNVRIDAGQGVQEMAGNELDAALVWRNQLLVLECKTGVQISTEGGSQSILNRLDSLRRHVGGAMGETWLLTARRLQQGAGCAARERARAYRIRLIEPEHLVDLREDVRQWMGLDPPPA
ncbi:conserved hypothetical protein [Candidatus Accumulibacter aalborgensis]|uniref:Card1 endonuclease domain-containing protein n=1 Tax=Candidatus Accumulibacter aalborgensis TaxID=1860102 RepID=A0A1A8XJJ9_9PROT|nr:DUF1887 family CARF protein [Candidatus Accumulibacter aalborgensis]SBT04118.1 conserved hypothetical protein [Candidatus Accumulibacter aalborgensis]